jgi:hypothetical protein
MYERVISRKEPGLLLCLIDRSYSMRRPLAGHLSSMAETVARVVNDFLYTLSIRCTLDPNEPPRPYFYLGLIGYGEESTPAGVHSLFTGALDGKDIVDTRELAQNPTEIIERPPDDDRDLPGGPAPVWIYPSANGGTPMCAALFRAGNLAQKFCKRFPTSYPPVVFNITDGEPTDEMVFEGAGQRGSISEWAERLKSIRTDDGHLLMFNVYLSPSAADRLVFPSDPTGLPEYGAKLFGMSSELPHNMVERAQNFGIDTEDGARGFMMNAGAEDVASMLDIGSQGAQLDR